MGKSFRVTRSHGAFVSSSYAERTVGTVHPSAILRAPTDELRRELRKQFVDDFKKIAKLKL
jgi:uracil-DNA glycosylase